MKAENINRKSSLAISLFDFVVIFSISGRSLQKSDNYFFSLIKSMLMEQSMCFLNRVGEMKSIHIR